MTVTWNHCSSLKLLHCNGPRPDKGRNRQNCEIARAGCWSWGLIRGPGSQQGREDVRRRSSLPSVTESKRRHRRRRNAAVLRVPRAILARIPATARGGRNGGPAPKHPPRGGGLACRFQCLARQGPLPAQSWMSGRLAPPQASTIPGLQDMSGIVAQKPRVFRSGFGRRK